MKRVKKIIISILVFTAIGGYAKIPDLHSSFDYLLKKYVSEEGKVNYEGLKTEINKLNDYLNLLSSSYPNEKWTKNKQLAYWINLYNAATLQLILKNYPIKSIMNINNGKAWDVKFIKSGTKMLTLNQIENEIIRPNFNEPRIHFAVNCAAISCPKLLNEAFTPEKIETQLETATRNFINTKQKNTINQTSVKVSKIFEWYAVDFGGKNNIINYLNKYSNIKIEPKSKILFKEYNWGLNN